MPFGGLHWEYLLIILAIILIIFGPSKLPQLGSAIGRTMKEFRKETSTMGDDVKHEIDKPEDEKPSVAAATEKSGK